LSSSYRAGVFEHAFDEVLAAALDVIERAPGPSFRAEVARHAATLAPSAVLLALPLAEGRLLDAAGVLDLFADSGATIVVSADGLAMVGLAGALANLVDDHTVDTASGDTAPGDTAPGDTAPGDAPLVDERGVLFHRFSSSSVVLAGAVIDADDGREPPVVLCNDLGALDRALADEGSRDLVRILRYRDAAAPARPAAVVANEMLVVPFWTVEFCATIIRAAEAVDAFRSNDDDPVPGHEVSLAAISPRLFAHVEDDLAVRVMPDVQEMWPYADYFGLRDVFVIKYAPSGQTELRIHHDVAQLSGSVRLNDGYGGARLAFPRQGFDNGELAVGDLLLWPSLVTHPHRCEPLEHGVKYALTLWFELPGGQRA
jgi:hypothetical protein